MLFNSTEFLFFFLPATLAGFLLLKKHGYGRAAMGFIALASLFFYGWWNLNYLGLLLGSVIFNFTTGRLMQFRGACRLTLIIGISGNLICLGIFKYFNFFVDNVNVILSNDLSVPSIILPLGISFFTFQQIAYLVDVYKGEVKTNGFLEYLVFVTFFPQLIAGPIVHQKSMMPQFREHPEKGYDWKKSSMGLSLFAIGLFKKVVLADTFASYASPIFAIADNGGSISFLQGWEASLSYTLQLYFDFSGYSDMAIGLGLMFGVQLPANFLSPYKATNIIDFWRTWHITLSRFLKDYLYIPLGGNRKGKTRRYVNLIITMLLGGLWHGAAWTFVLWGGLHGLYLMANHAFRRLFPQRSQPTKLRRLFGWFITMLAVIIAWVLFRATSIHGAFEILSAMSGLNLTQTTALQSSTEAFWLIALGFTIVRFMPNSLELMKLEDTQQTSTWYTWQTNKKWIALTIGLLLASLYTVVYNSNRISEFIYFQF